MGGRLSGTRIDPTSPARRIGIHLSTPPAGDRPPRYARRAAPVAGGPDPTGPGLGGDPGRPEEAGGRAGVRGFDSAAAPSGHEAEARALRPTRPGGPPLGRSATGLPAEGLRAPPGVQSRHRSRFSGRAPNEGSRFYEASGLRTGPAPPAAPDWGGTRDHREEKGGRPPRTVDHEPPTEAVGTAPA